MNWILCDDRLPKANTSVLVTFIHNKYDQGQTKRVKRVGTGFHNGKRWSSVVGAIQSYRDVKVIAWMPLPRPYEDS